MRRRGGAGDGGHRFWTPPVLVVLAIYETPVLAERRRAKVLDEQVGMQTRELVEEKTLPARQALHPKELTGAKDRLLANLLEGQRSRTRIIGRYV